ncbi:hypothetical protein HanXRQr2_Chr05g0229861 [Helianthus annuus]|uniref:Uncharacterized protein n=1 Tax=Helianthus annuus TaxID=4232 RepID=A0A9K3J2C2_HELAN|nr:hypothetical protein HanXRQr2_Chr05g0229861 [Helianthus annuus]KAJ0923870.1 hypothetical protein HanPSC8_Chr05g0221711 [Helianthus annuus]
MNFIVTEMIMIRRKANFFNRFTSFDDLNFGRIRVQIWYHGWTNDRICVQIHWFGTGWTLDRGFKRNSRFRTREMLNLVINKNRPKWFIIL